jgi:hypothetical protein
MPTLEDVLTELAAAPPSAFTRARDTLLARLTKLGQVQVAARVKAVRRPTAPLWAVNRLAREEPESVERLIATADRMRAAQLGQGASAADFTGASREQRAALGHLTDRAGAILRQAGLGATHQVLVRVETTLAGAASDPQLRPALREGRLEHELAARGFDVFAGERVPPPRPAATPGQSAPTSRPPAGTAPAGVSPAQKPERDRDEARLAAAREAVTQAETRATQQREQVASARKRVEEFTEMRRDARRQEVEAAREEKRAAAALRAARNTLRAAERKRRS